MKGLISLTALVVIFLSTSGCGGAPAHNPVPTVDPAPIHTQMAATLYAANAAFASATPSPTASSSTAPAEMPEISAAGTPEPTQTESPTPTAQVITVPTMENIPLLQGYSYFGVRVLERPAAVVRDGITLQVEQVIVFPDHIELVYTYRGIPHDSLFVPMVTSEENTCGGPDSYANLMLPGGEVIIAENYLLDGKAFGTIQGPYAYGYLIHIYRAVVPEEVREMTLLLKCLEMAELDRAPLNWQVPFRVVPANENP